MPTFRKLSPAEVHTLEYTGTSQRRRIEAEYDEILRSFAPGDYAQVELEGDEKRLTVRNRLTAAATRSGVTLHFLRTPPPTTARLGRDRRGGWHRAFRLPWCDRDARCTPFSAHGSAPGRPQPQSREARVAEQFAAPQDVEASSERDEG